MTASTSAPADEPPGTRHPAGSSRLGGSPPPGDGGVVDDATRTAKRTVNRGWYVLLLLPFIALLWLPFYARRGPELFGFPFFYWYQFLWVFLGAGITGLVYVLTTTGDAPTGERTYDGSATGRHGVGRP